MATGVRPRSEGPAGQPASPQDGRIRLDRLEAGHCGTVCEVLAGEDETDRLKAMGVCAGRRVMLVRRGDPMILKVLGSRIGVSARLAHQVYVVDCPSDECNTD